MAPNSDQEAGASCPLDDLDRSDPPPPPDHKNDTREQVALNQERMDDWVRRNMDHLKSYDSRGLQHLPLLSRLWGYDYSWYSAWIIIELAEVSSWAGRRLDPEEMSVFTSHTARGVVAASYDRPIAAGVTTLALYRGWSSFRMPFYQPRFTRFMHPQATQRPLLSSLAWHSARVGVYGMLGLAAYKLLSLRYQSYMVDSFINDAMHCEPGLETLNDSISENLDGLDKERDRRRGKTE